MLENSLVVFVMHFNTRNSVLKFINIAISVWCPIHPISVRFTPLRFSHFDLIQSKLYVYNEFKNLMTLNYGLLCIDQWFSTFLSPRATWMTPSGLASRMSLSYCKPSINWCRPFTSDLMVRLLEWLPLITLLVALQRMLLIFSYVEKAKEKTLNIVLLWWTPECY